jgi:outer membrane protein insertion porin family/translocation and assembly module TamA
MRHSIRVWTLALLAAAFAACGEQGTVTVHSLSFKGVNSVSESRLRQALATRENTKVPLLGWELPWGRKNFFDRSRFDADLQRIKAFYADRGFPDARVTGFDVKLNSKQTAVDVTLTIDEGEPVKVAAINFEGFDAVPERHMRTLKNTLPLQPGQPRDRQLVVSSHEAALNELRDHGYPYAKVTTDEDDGPNGKSATITFTADPGPLAHFGDVEIAGNQSVSDHVIERELTFKPGDLYQRSLVQNSQRRLYGMELFQFVNIETLNPESQAPDVRTRVTVAEGKHQRVNFGVGYGTEEKARMDAEYHHLNFLGGARSAGVRARYSSLDRGLRLDFNQPYFLAPHFSLGGEAQQWYTYTPAYDSIVTGGRAILTHRESQRTSWSVSFTTERDKSNINTSYLNRPGFIQDLIALGQDPSRPNQTGTLNAIGFDAQRSTADNILNARRGYQLAFHTEKAGGILPGTFSYYALTLDGRHYLPISDSLVAATRLQFGNIAPSSADPNNVPFSKKYFLGGATSLRGWGRFEVSPVGASGIPLGGNSMFAFSEELRVSFGGNLGAVLFADAGNVWTDRSSFSLGDLRYDIGPGLRYQTPVGPIRFDIGYQLNPIPGLLVNGSPQTRRWRMHFSIGQAF